jgi:hypothetical protein
LIADDALPIGFVEFQAAGPSRRRAVLVSLIYTNSPGFRQSADGDFRL